MPGTRRAARILAQSAQPLKHVTRIMGEKRILHSWPRRGQAARALGAGSGVGGAWRCRLCCRELGALPSAPPITYATVAPLFGDAAFALPTRGRSIWQGRGLSHHPLPSPPPAGCGVARFRRVLRRPTLAGQGLARGGAPRSVERVAHRIRGAIEADGRAPGGYGRCSGGGGRARPGGNPSLCRENGRRWSDSGFCGRSTGRKSRRRALPEAAGIPIFMRR